MVQFIKIQTKHGHVFHVNPAHIIVVRPADRQTWESGAYVDVLTYEDGLTVAPGHATHDLLLALGIRP